MFGSRGARGRRSRVGILAALLLVLCGAFAWSALAAPGQSKPYTATIATNPSPVAAGSQVDVTVTLCSASSDNSGFGSGEVTIPNGWSVDPASITVQPPPGQTWTGLLDGSVVKVRSTNSTGRAANGACVGVTFSAVAPCSTGTYTFTTVVHKSDNFQGPHNEYRIVGSQPSVTISNPCQLAITSVNGGLDPVFNTDFDVDVELQDATGTAIAAPTGGVDVTLEPGNSTSTGLGGNTTGTIAAGTSTTTIEGVRISDVQNNFELCPTSLGLDSVCATFDVLEARVTFQGGQQSPPTCADTSPTNLVCAWVFVPGTGHTYTLTEQSCGGLGCNVSLIELLGDIESGCLPPDDPCVAYIEFDKSYVRSVGGRDAIQITVDTGTASGVAQDCLQHNRLDKALEGPFCFDGWTGDDQGDSIAHVNFAGDIVFKH